MSKTSISYCTNCGEYTHNTKQCLLPITSFGTILFRVKGGFDPKTQAQTLIQSESSLNGLDETAKSNIQYLLIQRRDSLGYIDIMRGKYKIDDTEYISQQIRGMTREEQERLVSVPFDTLWEQLWGPPTEGSNPYKNEKETSRLKLATLRVILPDLIKSVNMSWPTPEWGFPKGRRDPHESEYICALREMKEETGLTEKDVLPIKNIDTIKETFFGSNHIQYCHKYFIMYVPNTKEIVFNPNNVHMSQEIGDIRWCSLDEALSLIRSENVEKREILLRVSSLLRNYCPFQFG